MSTSFDFQEMMTRLVKYIIEGLVVAVVASILPSKSLSPSEIILLALVAASIFSILDLLAPAISSGTRSGVGLGLGFQLAGLTV
jgi:ABC-type Co2+ transport system permease subunit